MYKVIRKHCLRIDQIDEQPGVAYVSFRGLNYVGHYTVVELKITEDATQVFVYADYVEDDSWLTHAEAWARAAKLERALEGWRLRQRVDRIVEQQERDRELLLEQTERE